jgi:hypothetical protein
VFRIRFQSFVTATAGGAAFDSIHHTGFAPAVSVRPETSRLSIEVQRQPNTVSLDLENR